MQFRILGPIEIEIRGRIVSPPPKERSLLGMLLLEANRVVPVDRIAELFWDGEPPKRVRGAVQGHISRLRALLSELAGAGEVSLTYAGEGYRLALDAETVDAHRFQELVRQAARTADLSHRAGQLRTALDLWRGPALADMTGGLRERLTYALAEQRLAATEDLASASLAIGREREILPELARAAGNHPGRESLVALHMRALHQAGRRGEALDSYTRSRVYLADELGIDPGPVLRELHQAILRDEPTVVESATSSHGSARAPVIPRQLPADTAGFTGRVDQLARLSALLPVVGSGTSAVVISAIRGTPGVGKTALAVHWAHRVADSFPDGQLYLNLRGFDPSTAALTVAEAVRTLLDGLQVPPRQLPASLDAQAALYRSILAGRRMLVVLDNARDAEQVRPLLPGAVGCMAVVTSRDRLSSLAAREGAQVLALDVLSDTEARQLLTSRLGTERVAAEPSAVDRIIRRCAGLPLALAVVAAHCVTQPGHTLRGLADQLADVGGLDSLTDPDSTTDVRSVFSWSYRALAADTARVFRLLGLHPGPDLTAPALASLAGVALPEASSQLTQLARASLINEHIPGRYALHDLMRSYAGELARQAEHSEETAAALHRMFDHYLVTAHAAACLFEPTRAPLTLLAPRPGVQLEPVGSREQAVAWLAAERAVLTAVVGHAVANGFDAHAALFPRVLATFLSNHGYRHEAITVETAGLGAARRLEDLYTQAQSHRQLGIAHGQQGRWEEAQRSLRQALDGFARLGKLAEQAAVHMTLGAVVETQHGAYDQTLRHAQQALELASAAGNRVGQARALNQIGWCHIHLGDPRAALSNCDRALAIQHDIGDLTGAANTLDTLARAHHSLGEPDRAIDCYRQALSLYDRSDVRRGRAETLDRLGDAYLAVDDGAAAGAAWREAVTIFDELGDAGGDPIRAKLGSLPG